MSKFKLLPIHNSQTRIGLLGGSFNPPHIGHVNITLQILKKFNLCKVFWLVTPCNPMKSVKDYESFANRFQKCVEITKQYSNKITVLDIETSFKNFFSSNTIQEIKRTHKSATLYWIIGCDNLLQIHKWYRWKNIFENANVIVYERTFMALKAHNTIASLHFRLVNIMHSEHNSLYEKFCILHGKRVNISSTNIRNMVLKDESTK